MDEQTNKPGSASPEQTPPPAVQKGKGKILVMIGGLVLLLGAGGVFLLYHRKTAQAAPAASTKPIQLYTLHLENFTVNLADPEENHYLRVTIDLGLDHAPVSAEGEKNGGASPIPQTRDTILSVLATCKADDLLTPEGKAKLKQDLVKALDQKVPELGVRDVYFTEFLVQR